MFSVSFCRISWYDWHKVLRSLYLNVGISMLCFPYLGNLHVCVSSCLKYSMLGYLHCLIGVSLCFRGVYPGPELTTLLHMLAQISLHAGLDK